MLSSKEENIMQGLLMNTSNWLNLLFNTDHGWMWSSQALPENLANKIFLLVLEIVELTGFTLTCAIVFLIIHLYCYAALDKVSELTFMLCLLIHLMLVSMLEPWKFLKHLLCLFRV